MTPAQIDAVKASGPAITRASLDRSVEWTGNGSRRTKGMVPARAPLVKGIHGHSTMTTDATTFQDITIVGADERFTQKRPGTSLFSIHFKLSSPPPDRWAQFFAEERRFARHSMWRDAKVSGIYIVVECALDEVQRHLDDIKADARTANDKYRKYLAAQAAADARAREAEDKERAEVASTLSKLKF